MFGYYILIKGILKLNQMEKEMLVTLLKEIMIFPKIEIKEDVLIAVDTKNIDISWEEFIIGTNNEFFTNLKLYESLWFLKEKELKEHINETINRNIFIEDYNTERTLLYSYIDKGVSESNKRLVFKELYHDKEFLKSIKIYLKENKNSSKAAKLSNMHRNTLLNRIEKFYKVTGLNLRDFDDATYVYLLLRDL